MEARREQKTHNNSKRNSVLGLQVGEHGDGGTWVEEGQDGEGQHRLRDWKGSLTGIDEIKINVPDYLHIVYFQLPLSL